MKVYFDYLQDGGDSGEGTVLTYSRSTGQINVKWDSGIITFHHFMGAYDLKLAGPLPTKSSGNQGELFISK